MDMQSRLSDESGGVVAHVQSVDGDGRMMRLLCDIACASEPRVGRTLWLMNSQPSFRAGSSGPCFVGRHASSSRRVSRRGSSSGSGGIHAEGCPPPSDDEPARGAWGHCNLGSGFSLRSTSMDQSKSWLSQTQSKNPALGHAS